MDATGLPVEGAEVYLFQMKQGKSKSTSDNNWVPQLSGPFKSNKAGLAACGDAIFLNENGKYSRTIYARVAGKLVGVAVSANYDGIPVTNPKHQVSMHVSRSVEGTVKVPTGFDPAKATVIVDALQVSNGGGAEDDTLLDRTLTNLLPQFFTFQPDGDGKVAIKDVPAYGFMVLVATAPGLAATKWSNTTLVDGSAPKDNFDNPIGISMQKESVISGRVVAPDGKPLSDVVVFANRRDSSDNVFIHWNQVPALQSFEATTDKSGAFSLRNLPTGNYRLELDEVPNNWAIVQPMEVSTYPAAPRIVKLQVLPTVQVSGRVLDAAGKPVAGAFIYSSPGSRMAGGLGEKGQFNLRLPATKVTLHVTIPNSQTGKSENLKKELDLKPGQAPITDLNFSLPLNIEEKKPADKTGTSTSPPAPAETVAAAPPGTPAEKVEPKTAAAAKVATKQLTVQCVDAAGKPVAGAEVYVMAEQSEPNVIVHQPSEVHAVGPVRSDAKGNAVIELPGPFDPKLNTRLKFFGRVDGKSIGMTYDRYAPGQQLPATLKLAMLPSKPLIGTLSVPAGFDPSKVVLRYSLLSADKSGWLQEDETNALGKFLQFHPNSQGDFQIDFPRDLTVGILNIQGDGLTDVRWGHQSVPEQSKLDLKPVKFAMRPEAVVTGKVTLPDGKPADGAEMYITTDAAAPNGEANNFGWKSYTLTADDSGNYELRGVPPGKIRVMIHDLKHRGLPVAASEHPVVGGKKNELNFTLEPGVVVSGRVLDDKNKAVEGVKVDTSYGTGGVSAADGRYQVRMRPGAGKVMVSLPLTGYRNPGVKEVTVKAGQTELTGQDIVLQPLAPGEKPEMPSWSGDLYFGNPPKEKPRDAPKKIAVQCVDEAGKPVEGAEVYLFQMQYSDRYSLDRKIAFSGPFKSNAAGVAECVDEIHLPGPTKYARTIYARIPDKLVGIANSSESAGHVPQNPENRVTLRPSTSVEVKLSVPKGFDPANVTARVRSILVSNGTADEAKAGQGAEITAVSTAAAPQLFKAQKDASGNYLISNVPQVANLTLLATGTGLADTIWSNTTSATNVAKLTAPVKITMPSEAVLKGRVTTDDGRPLDGANVMAHAIPMGAVKPVISLEPEYPRTVKTDSKGEYRFRGLSADTPLGRYTLHVNDPQLRGLHDAADLTVNSQTPTERNFRLKPGIKVSGQVKDSNGKPIPKVKIFHGAGYFETDQDGKYQYSFAPKRVVLRCMPVKGYAATNEESTKQLDLKPNQPEVKNLDFVLKKSDPAKAKESEKKPVEKKSSDPVGAKGAAVAEPATVSLVLAPAGEDDKPKPPPAKPLAKKVLVQCVDSLGKPAVGAEVYLLVGYKNGQSPSPYPQFFPYGPFRTDARGYVECSFTPLKDSAQIPIVTLFARLPGKGLGITSRHFAENVEKPLTYEVTLLPVTQLKGTVSVPAGFDPTKVNITYLFFQWGSAPERTLHPAAASALAALLQIHPDKQGKIQVDIPEQLKTGILEFTANGLTKVQWLQERHNVEAPFQPEPIQVSLTREATISGTVLMPDGTPAEGIHASVSWRPPNVIPNGHEPQLFVRAYTDKSGRFTLSHLPAETVEFQFYDPQSRGIYKHTHEYKLTSGVAATVNLTMQAGIPVRGRVLNEEKKPIAGATLSTHTSETGGKTVTTNAAGEFELHALPGKSNVSIYLTPTSSQITRSIEIKPGQKELTGQEFILTKSDIVGQPAIGTGTGFVLEYEEFPLTDPAAPANFEPLPPAKIDLSPDSSALPTLLELGTPKLEPATGGLQFNPEYSPKLILSHDPLRASLQPDSYILNTPTVDPAPKKDETTAKEAAR